jgi:uncharacterized protein YjaZ
VRRVDIVVRDDAEAMRRLLRLPVADRLDALAAMRGLAEDDAGGRAFLRRIHEQGDGFRVDVDDPRYAPALERLIAADAWGQVQRDLQRAKDLQERSSPDIARPPRVEVVLTLGNPDRVLFMERTLGYYGMGAVPGTIWLCAWPTGFNVTRIGACAVHELAHNLRTPNVRGFDLAEWIVHEGLAELFAVEVCGPDSTGAWYAGVRGELFDRTWETVTGAFGTGSTLADWSPYVLGDPTSEQMGRPPVGVPHMGGYAVGRRIVERYLAATGRTAAEAIATPAADILEAAGVGR